MKTEGREVNPDQVNLHVVHPSLHQDYNLDFQMQRIDEIAGPDAPGPSHIGRPGATEGNNPLKQGGIDLDVTIPMFTPEDAAAVIISDDDKTSFPAGWPEAVSTPEIEPAWGQK